ncbi:MAG: DUF1499 domain-containing protein [Sneathiella sp.]
MRKILKTLFATIVILGLVILGLIYTPFGNQALTSLLSVGNIPVTDFKTLELTSSPNQYLICPQDYCTAPTNKVSPIFPIEASRLKARWDQFIASQPHISGIKPSDDGLQVDLVQRTDLILYPDIITARFIPLDDATSTLAIYSRSIYGKSDFGENKSRIEAWIAALNAVPQ